MGFPKSRHRVCPRRLRGHALMYQPLYTQVMDRPARFIRMGAPPHVFRVRAEGEHLPSSFRGETGDGRPVRIQREDSRTRERTLRTLFSFLLLGERYVGHSGSSPKYDGLQDRGCSEARRAFPSKNAALRGHEKVSGLASVYGPVANDRTLIFHWFNIPHIHKRRDTLCWDSIYDLERSS